MTMEDRIDKPGKAETAARILMAGILGIPGFHTDVSGSPEAWAP